MTKDDVLKVRGEVFDAALRVERARLAIEANQKQLNESRTEYNVATQELSSVRSKADAAEADAVQAATKGGRSMAEEINAAVDAVAR